MSFRWSRAATGGADFDSGDKFGGTPYWTMRRPPTCLSHCGDASGSLVRRYGVPCHFAGLGPPREGPTLIRGTSSGGRPTGLCGGHLVRTPRLGNGALAAACSPVVAPLVWHARARLRAEGRPTRSSFRVLSRVSRARAFSDSDYRDISAVFMAIYVWRVVWVGGVGLGEKTYSDGLDKAKSCGILPSAAQDARWGHGLSPDAGLHGAASRHAAKPPHKSAS